MRHADWSAGLATISVSCAIKFVIVAIAALWLACFSNNAQAEKGSNGAALLGSAAGIAIGATGATM